MNVEINGKIVPVKICSGIIPQTLGLMGTRGENALFIYTQDVQYRIHTWFCQNLQLIYLDNNKSVIESVSMKPFRTHRCKASYRYLLELSKPIKIKKGEKIYF